jgi:hypothetical protein
MHQFLGAASLLMMVLFVAAILVTAAWLFQLIEREASIWAKAARKKRKNKQRRWFWGWGLL